MHVLTLFVEGIATAFTLHYRSSGEASAAKDRVKVARSAAVAEGSELSIQDDFGQNLTISGWNIKAIVLLDVAQGLDAQLALMVMQQKAQSRASVAKFPGIVMPANMPGARQ
jgi:hypothetical protein